ncbi:hydrogenase maturation protease [Kitasatospora purpeofusca]|uniref:hydrogenase maturation protease n=1 Tax=Kitasatospora purpeofusca TaxID=67352 RepID=UPI002E131D78|nr:hydrogenase maturation protease [Kitasatospora purpeofusca]WSR37912.1 hydrogenase maturation protease [Kitasatospora purpeofusca]
MAADRTALVGVGNEYRHDDDGAAAAVLAELIGGGIEVDRVALCDGEPTPLIELWMGADLAVVFDAVHGHLGEPGRIHQVAVGPGLLDTPPDEAGGAGTHGLGLGHAVALASALGRLPAVLLIIAVEGAEFTVGQGLTPAVADAVPRAALLAREKLAAHRASREGGA